MKSITVIGQEHPSDKMTTEAFYRLFKILKPITSDVNFVSIGFIPEQDRLVQGITVKPTLGIWDTLKAIVGIKSDVYMFWYGGHKKMVLPMLFLKLFRNEAKKIVRIDGTGSRFYQDKGLKKKILYIIHKLMEFLVFQSADLITYQYTYLPRDCRMERYFKKMQVSHQYVDTELFRNIKQHNERYFDLVFCGRFDANKGVMELLSSLDYLINTLKRDLRVMFIGDGELKHEIANQIIEKKLHGVNYSRYIPQHEVAMMIGNSRFIVIPSHVEGVPKVALEAMACGTIVIASRAGGLKYLIEDGKTGFTIEKIDRYGIADAISRALDCPISKRIEILNRYQEVLVDYSYNAVQSRYRQILNA